MGDERGRRERLRIDVPRRVPPDRPPPAGMPPLPLMLLDAMMDDAESLDTVRDCGDAPPHGLALVGERHLIAAARRLVLDGLVEVEETVRDADGGWVRRRVAAPATDDDSLLRHWYRPTERGTAVWRGAEAELDRYHGEAPETGR